MNTLNLKTQFVKHSNIGIVYDPMCMYAKLMIQEHYSSKEYDNTIFLLTPCNGFDFNISNPITRDLLHNIFNFVPNKIIFLNFDHLADEYYLCKLNDYLCQLAPDEIWEWQYENVLNNKYTLQDRVKFMPLRYVSYYEQFGVKDYIQQEYTCHSICNICNDRRIKLFSAFGLYYMNFKILSGSYIYTRINELKSAGFSLNVHGSDYNLREQLRISENLCLNIPVATENDNHKYYDGLVYNYDYYYALDNPTCFFNSLQENYDLYKCMNVSSEYKRLTYSDDSYERYKNDIIQTY